MCTVGPVIVLLWISGQVLCLCPVLYTKPPKVQNLPWPFSPPDYNLVFCLALFQLRCCGLTEWPKTSMKKNSAMRIKFVKGFLCTWKHPPKESIFLWAFCRMVACNYFSRLQVHLCKGWSNNWHIWTADCRCFSLVWQQHILCFSVLEWMKHLPQRQISMMINHEAFHMDTDIP